MNKRYFLLYHRFFFFFPITNSKNCIRNFLPWHFLRTRRWKMDTLYIISCEFNKFCCKIPELGCWSTERVLIYLENSLPVHQRPNKVFWEGEIISNNLDSYICNFSSLYLQWVHCISILCYLGCTQCDQQDRNWWRCTYPRDRYTGREGFKEDQGALSWEKQCVFWSCCV